MHDSRLVILPATGLIGPLKKHITELGFWLNDAEMTAAIQWLIGQHVSDMGLLQLPTGALPLSIKNQYFLLASTEWVKPQLFNMLSGMSSSSHFCLTEFIVSDNNLFLRW